MSQAMRPSHAVCDDPGLPDRSSPHPIKPAMEKRMVSKTEVFARLTRAAWWLPCLLGGAVAAHAAGTGQSLPTAPADAPAAADAAATTYRVINLGTGSLSQIPAINASGQVAFSLFGASGAHAWFYDGHTVHDIGTLGGPTANAVALNDAGQVAGYADSSTATHAFRWSMSTGMVDLGVIGGGPGSQATAINKHGLVVGLSDIGSLLEPVHAFLWSAATGMQDLGSPFGDSLSLSAADAINDAGLIAGDAELGGPGYNNHAFAWTRATGMVDLGTLLGGNTSYTVAVDAKGQVTGWADVPGGNNHAFLWTRHHGMRDLGTAGGTESFPLAMSPGGQMVGVIDFAAGNQHAMSWTGARGMHDLGTLGGDLSRALGVNNKGQVVGSATTATTTEPSHAFVWSAARGMVDLNKRVHHLPAGLLLESADAIADNGEIVAETNAGLVLLVPGVCHCSGPVLGPVTGPEMVTTGAPFSASASFANENTTESHSVSWSWGDGSSDSSPKASESGGAGSANALHVYARPGIYTVTAQVTDRSGKRAAVSRNVVVFEPAAGFAAGTGAFVSPPGAIRKAPAHSGKAKFAFFAPSPGTPTAPGAKPLLVFSTGRFGFRSEDFKPVAVQGGSIRFEGSGRVNSAGSYRFSLATTAGTADASRFFLKIWHTDPATGAQVVDYDNQAGKNGAPGGVVLAGRIAVQ
jgi:probable HAF family extracellular repeat protein